jgi:DNA-binding LytR/AlgR family response regulator
MKLRCLLIDDEPMALTVLASYIDSIEGLEIVAECGNVFDALAVLQKKKVDVMFLDIKMPKMLGIDFLRNLSSPPKVIMVTAYREYAVESYDLDVVDYLVKPVSFERFFKSITRLYREFGMETSAGSEKETAQADPFVYMKVDRDMVKVYLHDILYIESLKDYVRLFMSHGGTLIVRQSMNAMEDLLSDRMFIRVHRSYMVSLDRISSYNGIVIKLDKTEIPIGRLYKQAVLDRLDARSV